MAHTPGPWGIVFHGDVERIRLNGSTVYQVSDVTDPDFPSGQPRYCLDDLLLMAAAPELLALVKRLREVFEELDDDWRVMDATRVDELIASDGLYACDQAIAKAEGKGE
jgi:hypothetical protein